MPVLPLCLAILSGLSFALLGLSYKAAEQRQCRPQYFTITYMLTAGILSVLLAAFQHTELGNSRLWLLGLAMGIVMPTAIYFTLYAISHGSAAIVWTVVTLALLIPILLAPVLFHEPFRFIDSILVVLFVLMLGAFARGMGASGPIPKETWVRYTGAMLLAFLLNGCWYIGYKYKELWIGPHSSSAFASILYLSGVVFALAALAVQKQKVSFLPSEWKIGASSGVCSFIGVLSLLGAMSLPAVVVFPISQGISLLGAAMLTVLLYGEKMNVYKLLGFALGFSVLVLSLLRDRIIGG